MIDNLPQAPKKNLLNVEIEREGGDCTTQTIFYSTDDPKLNIQ
jgi:hypothetical protein